MTRSKFGFRITLLVFVLLSTGMPVFSAELGLSFVKVEVTKRDARGRVEMMELRTDSGKCIAQITYDQGPQINLMVILRAELQSSGTLKIIDGTEEGLSNETLMEKLDETFRDRCLPTILQDYISRGYVII